MLNRLFTLNEKMDTVIGRKAVRAMGTEYLKRVRKQIPLDNKDDVHLKKSLGMKIRKPRPGFIYAVAGVMGKPRKKARRYAHIFEFGSKFIRGRRVFSKTLESDAPAILRKLMDKLKTELGKVGA